MRTRTPAGLWCIAATLAITALASAVRANVELDVLSGQTDLNAAATYNGGVAPAAANDVTFTNTTYAPAINFSVTGTPLAIGTLNDLDTAETLTIANTSGAAAVLSLAGGANSVGGSALDDLLYVAGGGVLTINGGVAGPPASTLALTLNASGNLDVAGAANIGAATSWGANAITKTGAGTLALTSTVANTSTGTFTIANGAVSIGGGGNAGNTALGASGNAVILGADDNNVLLTFATPESGIAQNFTIAAGSGARTITSAAGSATQGNAAIFAASNTITLNNTLVVANLVASAPAANVLGFRGVIKESGGSFGLIVDAANVGTVDLRAANTFSGGVSLNGGTATFNLASTPSAAGSTVTAGPFGTGVITLGGSPTTPVTLADASFFSLANAITVGATTNGSARTITEISNNSTAATINGAIALNADLTLTAVATTRTDGADRLRVGSGGITGSHDILINNPNAGVTSTTRAAIRIQGTATPTAWTGNLIIAAGLGSLDSANGLGAANTVSIAAGASFDFTAGAVISPTIAGLNDLSGAGGTLFHSSNSGRTLTLAGSGAYTFGGTILDSSVAPNTTAIAVSLGAASASQTFSGSNTYTGGTTIANGKLLLTNTTGSATGAGVVNLGSLTLGTAADATLGGTGSSTGLLTAVGGARLAPGVNTADADGSGRGNFGAAGTLSIGTTGGLALTAANLDFDLSNSAAAGNDAIATGGTLTFGALTFNFNELNGSLATGTPYTLISGTAAITGDPTAIATRFLNGTMYTPVYSFNGNALQVTFSTAAVPEPATLGLMGAASLILLRRRRR